MITKKIIRALYERFVTIFGKRFTHDFEGHDNRLIMWVEDWYEGLLGIDPKSFKGAIYHLMTQMKWPPTLAEFRELCEKESGIPNEHQVMLEGVKKNFYHPLIKLVYDKIGSWDFHNASEEKLTKLIALYYPECLTKMRKDCYLECKKQLNNPDLKVVTHDKEVEDGRRDTESDYLGVGNLLSPERNLPSR